MTEPSKTPRTDAICARSNTTPEDLRLVADLNEKDAEVGKGIADGQREHADLLELCRDLERELADAQNRLSEGNRREKRLRVACIQTVGWLESFRDPSTTGEGERQEHIDILDAAIYDKAPK